MLASLGKPREEILYENSEEQRVGKKTWSPKLYENSEISLDRFFSVLHKTHENHEKLRPREKSGSPKTHENSEFP